MRFFVSVKKLLLSFGQNSNLITVQLCATSPLCSLCSMFGNPRKQVPKYSPLCIETYAHRIYKLQTTAIMWQLWSLMNYQAAWRWSSAPKTPKLDVASCFNEDKVTKKIGKLPVSTRENWTQQYTFDYFFWNIIYYFLYFPCSLSQS